ncbi:hypothetical protein KP509_08G003500 [Ceratopteris richardii]|uniref:Carboxypeptidase n=1 Tax=Ceratopteris richardii TaxID=49495 RepID=A0A8T2U460_CERRI|nr:hypothetical protein KP509_08G003500 [Ceratopteris richardii]
MVAFTVVGRLAANVWTVLIFLLHLPLFLPPLYFTEGAPSEALVESLPGFDGTFPSKHYAGYITVDEEYGRNLYYYFVTSSNDPTADPLVLWMNGGPGCSSFDGFIYEHGPFHFEVNKTYGGLPGLKINHNSWTKVASIIYLESPVGVGFSYSNITIDYTIGDLKTARDVHTFILKWYEQYPEFQSNSLYVAGESYAGVYVPTAVEEIVMGIQNGVEPLVNLKGYLIGNGVTDEAFDGDALVPFVHGMGLISNQLYEETVSSCNGSYSNPTDSACIAKLDKIDEEIDVLNIYDILEPCYHDMSLQAVMDIDNLPKSFRRLGDTKRTLPTRRRMFGRAWPLRSPVRAGLVPSWPSLGLTVPCLDFEIANRWLNHPAVREAIHAQPVSAIGIWTVCKDLSYYHDAGSMLPYHKKLLESGYRVLIYRWLVAPMDHITLFGKEWPFFQSWRKASRRRDVPSEPP